MKVTLLLVSLLIGTAWSAKIFNEDIKEFEKEFNTHFSGGDLEEKAAKNLEETEKQINENNEKFEKGESTFEEKLYPESILDDDEFKKEKEGLNLPDGDETRRRNSRFAIKNIQGTGLVLPPESERNGPLNDAKLAKIDAKLAQNRETTPTAYNSVTEGHVTEVKSQGSCGSCAAFASTAMHETCMLKAGATITDLDLSEQQILDCGYDGNAYSMNGCGGAGISAYTNWFINTLGGEGAHENTYPYAGVLQTCPNSLATYSTTAKVTSYISASNYGEDRLKEIVVQYGAAMVAIYSSDTSFKNYARGVFSGCSSTAADHAVLVVGYGTQNGIDYWLVKNSWSTNWGISGYVKIKRGSDECGIESAAMSAASCNDENVLQPCDISGTFGSGITGSGTLQISSGGQTYTSYVTCNNSLCSPQNPTGITDSCVYICGQTTC